MGTLAVLVILAAGLREPIAVEAGAACTPADLVADDSADFTEAGDLADSTEAGDFDANEEFLCRI